MLFVKINNMKSFPISDYI